VVPATLAIHAGDVVHFQNANASAGTCTILADDGVFASPPLARGEGWHHTFSDPGTYGFFVEEFPSARGKIVVVEGAGSDE
jgi:plastocyanin